MIDLPRLNNTIINSDILDSYTTPDDPDLDTDLCSALKALNRKIVVLDDDPTGTQTVHDVSVYTDWDEASIAEGFTEASPIFFILTNSRSFSREETIRVHTEIARTLYIVAQKKARKYLLVSRDDSTLRGHFPEETEALKSTLEGFGTIRFDGEIIIPFFKEGGRYTLNNVHYVKDSVGLVPVSRTEFASDKSFGFVNSHLGAWVEEKTRGRYNRNSCTYIALDDLRARNVSKIYHQLLAVKNFGKVIVNAIDYRDVKVFVLALVQAVLDGKEFLFRSAASLPKVLGNIKDKSLLSRNELITNKISSGGIVLVGSHVNNTTVQLEALRGLANSMEVTGSASFVPSDLSCHVENKNLAMVQFDQHLVTVPGGLEGEVRRVVALTESLISKGNCAVIYTRRERIDLQGGSAEDQLAMAIRISDALSSIIAQLKIRPAFIIAKGGITSSDVAIKALRVKKARVIGQIRPGIPVWITGPESKFPGLPYIIFPGNVGDRYTLKDIILTIQG